MSPSRRDRPAWRALRHRNEFSRVYESGVKLVGRLFVLYLFPGDDLARAVVASRRVGGAVERNRAKRLLREALAACIQRPADAASDVRHRLVPQADPGDGLWVVAVARSAILRARCADVVAELDRLLRRQ